MSGGRQEEKWNVGVVVLVAGFSSIFGREILGKAN